MNLRWYETFFHGLALELWRRALPPEVTQADADFLEQEFALPKQSLMLDIPCGNGRVGRELFRRGYRVTGVDISEEFLQEARASSPEIEWILGDMLAFERAGVYDAAFCLGNSFCYLPPDDTALFVGRLARSLKPGGVFVADTGTAAESLLPHLKERETYEFDGIVMEIENRYHADRSCLETFYRFHQGAKTQEGTSIHWVYTVRELLGLIERNGFAPGPVYSSAVRDPFTLGDERLILTAKKPR